MTLARLSFVGAAAVSVALAGCTDPNAVPAGQNTQSGALIGGLIGAGIGVIAGDDDPLQSAIVGGALGAAAGGVIGYEIDKQEAELRRDLDNQSISVANTGDRLILSFPNDLTFATDSAAISPAVRGDLATVADSLTRYPGSIVRIVGHTDSDGEAGYNQALSERRANSVADAIAAGGVPYGRMQIIGRGENDPIASNLDSAGKARNRRVEIEIIPQQG